MTPYTHCTCKGSFQVRAAAMHEFTLRRFKGLLWEEHKADKGDNIILVWEEHRANRSDKGCMRKTIAAFTAHYFADW